MTKRLRPVTNPLVELAVAQGHPLTVNDPVVLARIAKLTDVQPAGQVVKRAA